MADNNNIKDKLKKSGLHIKNENDVLNLIKNFQGEGYFIPASFVKELETEDETEKYYETFQNEVLNKNSIPTSQELFYISHQITNNTSLDQKFVDRIYNDKNMALHFLNMSNSKDLSQDWVLGVSLANNKDFIKELCNVNISNLALASDSIRNDTDFIINLITKDENQKDYSLLERQRRTKTVIREVDLGGELFDVKFLGLALDSDPNFINYINFKMIDNTKDLTNLTKAIAKNGNKYKIDYYKLNNKLQNSYKELAEIERAYTNSFKNLPTKVQAIKDILNNKPLKKDLIDTTNSLPEDEEFINLLVDKYNEQLKLLKNAKNELDKLNKFPDNENTAKFPPEDEKE